MSDYYNQNYLPENSFKDKIKHFLKVVFFIFVVFFVISTAFSYKVIFSQDSVLKGIGEIPVIKQLKNWIGLQSKLNGEKDDRINFLLTGQGGAGHDGPYLTDTIILGSVRPTNGEVVLISIPRDFLVQIPGDGWYKINSINAFGETGPNKNGSELLAKTIENVFGVPIHYYLRVDFSAFEELINEVGGITICIDKTFSDNLYPTDDFLTKTVSFEKGCQKMDGATALVFARSRHGNNGEGSDFARAVRQQKIMVALKNKVFNWKTVFNPNLIYSIFNLTEKHIQTNIKKGEIPSFINLAGKIADSEVRHILLNDSPEGLLKASITEEGAYVLVPRAGDYSQLRELFNNVFEGQAGDGGARILLLNGTIIEGFGKRLGDLLSALNFRVLETKNAPTQDYKQTIIYKMNDEKNPETQKTLSTILKGEINTNPPPVISLTASSTNPDFVVVLGCEKEEECIEK
ncbi:MAG: LCP family protein [Patescibacteria group bacterium]|nr:LCP family protein [Patescibacteria group bacterium]